MFGTQSCYGSQRRRSRPKMSLLLILHVANFIIPSLGDLRNVTMSGVSAGWGDDIGSIWWPLLRIVFKKAKSVQVVRLPTSGTMGHSLWSDLVPNFHRRLSKSVTVWNGSNESFVRDIRQMDNANDEVRYFLLIIGSDYLHLLTDSNIWLSRSNYIILVEKSDQCSKNFNFLFHRHVYLVPHLYFVLSSCPEFAYIVERDVPNSSLMLSMNNVTHAISMSTRYSTDLRNSTLRVAMFPRYPTAVRISGSKQKWTDFEGIDGFFLETLSDFYHLRPILVYPDDGQTYGAYENNTAAGTLGIVLRGEADIALNGRFLIDYGTNEIELTMPYLTDKLCIMAPRSGKVPSYIAMFRCFDKPAWLLLLLAYIIGSVVWSFIARGFDNQKQTRSSSPRDVYLMLLAGFVSKTSPQTPAARIFIASCLIFSVVFMGAFQGLLYQSMTSPTYYPEMNTLDDVDRSGLPIVTASLSLKDALPADDEDPLIQRLRSKLTVIRDGGAWNKIKEDDSNYASLWRRNDAFLRLNKSQAKLHLVEECPRSYFLSFVAQKKSPYLQLVNTFILRCNEHGLVQLWRDRTYKFTAEDLRYMQNYDRDLTVKLQQVQAPFFLLCVGLVSSALVFVYETAGRHHKRGKTGNGAPRVTKHESWWRYDSYKVKRFVGKLLFRQHRHTHFPFLH